VGYVVSELIEGRSRPQSGAARRYRVKWDGVGQNSPELAREAVIAYLGDFAETYAAGPSRGQIRRISAGAAFDPATERRLDYWLHGFPIASADCDEVAGSDGGYYKAVVRWSRPPSAGVGLAAAGGASELTAWVGTEVEINVSGATSAGVQGGAVDFLPLVYLLSRETQQVAADTVAKIPPFPYGAVNAFAPEADSGAVKIRGLNVQGPPARAQVTLEVSGAPISAAFRQAVVDAADAGTLNQNAFTINGIQWQPLEVLLVQADIRTRSEGSTVIELGFATGRRKALTVEASGDLRTAKVGAFVHGDPTFTFAWPETGLSAGPAYVSPHDYVWNYAAKDSNFNRTMVDHVSIHRPWQVLDYQASLFKVAAL
jgi:hypothetical protein